MPKKKIHLEFLRFLAILLVVFNHTGENGYLYFTTVPGSKLYPLYFFLSVLCKIAVPLFWMVSGALLLNRDEDIKTVFTHRFLRVALVLALFSFGYYLYSAKGNPDFRFSIVYFLELLYSTDLAPAFWYLYAYLGLLILLPVLRKAAKHLTNEEFMYFFAAMLLLRGLLPILEYALWHGERTVNPSFLANFFSYDVVFFLMGYFLEHRVHPTELKGKRALALLILGAAAIALMMLATQLRLHDGGAMTDADGEMFYAGLLLVPSAAVFYSARLLFKNADENSALSKVFLMLGSVSFGVMLLEHFVRCETGFVMTGLSKVLPVFTSAVLWTLVVYILAGAVIWLLKKIPAVNKLL